MELATPNLKLQDLINLEEYPIQNLEDTRTQSLIARYRDELSNQGYCVLKGFLMPDALKIAKQEAESLTVFAYNEVRQTNPYQTRDEPTLPLEHPIRHFEERSSGFVSKDKFRDDSLFLKIYQNDFFIPFLSQCFREKLVFQYEDCLAGVILNVMQPETYLPWHFDQHDLNMLIMINAANDGGVFEIAPNLRTANNENYPKVAKVLQGEKNSSKQLTSFQDGDLCIFNGKQSLHRVTNNTGDGNRYTVSFAYTSKRKYRGNPESNHIVYGLSN
jgi:hypothetical protein